MSGNQKQTSGVVSQPQTRYPQGPFVTSRPPTPQRTTDAYHVTTPPTFVAQQPPNQGNNQGPNLRSMAPTGPPNNASTPPNTDLKVQQMPQASVNLTAYMPQTAQVRATGQNYYNRPPPPQSQTIRPNHRQGNQPIYPQTQMQYLPIASMQHVYPNTNVSFQFNQRPTTGYVQPYPSIPAQAISSYAPYPQTQTPQQIYAFTYPAQIAVQRQGPPPPVATAPQNHTQANPSTMVLTQNSQQTGMQQKNRRRAKAIPIIDPDTGKDKLKEMFEQQEQDESHPASGESSARQTPQPSVPNPSKEVQATFAKQVAQAIGNDETTTAVHHHSHLETSDHLYSHSHHPQPPPQQQQHQHHQQQHNQGPHHQQSTTATTPTEYVGSFPTHHHHHHQAQQHAHSPSSSTMLQTNVSNHPQAVQNNGRMDQIVLTSSLKAQAKEFVSQTAKEVTPVVSALTDSEEVTISKQPPKDRESPAKGRKQLQVQREQQTKEQPAPPKDAFICEKPPATASVVSNSGSNNGKDETPSRSSLSPQQQQRNDIPTCSGDAGGVATSTHYQQQQQQNVPVTGNKQHHQDVEKKSSKKDKTSSQAVSDQELIESSPALSTTASVVCQLTSEITPAVSGGKSKQNAAQKSKDNQKQANHQQQQQATGGGGGFVSTAASNANKPPQTVTPLPVPQSQPAKANNKTNKMRELNQKGQLKQGSDMDAFSDDVAHAVVATKNNATSENGNKLPLATVDLVNTNTTVIVENSKITNEKLVEKASTPLSAANNNHVAALPTSTPSPSVPTMPAKSRVDVTSIVPNMAPVPVAFTAPVDPTAVPALSRDETDRATVIANDKLVQAKNKANRTPPVTIDHNNVIDTKNNTTYKEVPISEEKKKVYTLEDLLSLKNAPASRMKPEKYRIPPELFVCDDRARIGDINRFAVRNTPDFAPQFSSGAGTYPGRGSSQRGPVVNKRGSQSGKPSGANKGGKQSVIKVSISVKEDVKLHETENAWRPARLVMGASMTEDDKKTEQLYRKVRGILNKLTPQKFQTLLGQIQSLTIDTCERLQGVIDLVFEKAVDEPNFSVAYALLCRELALMQVPNSEEVRKKDGQEYVNFRKLLVTRCQREFEKNSVDEEERNSKVKEIEECADPEKKKELQLELEEYDRRLRMKSVGNIRFIGELYKQQMLTGNIMVRCILNLLEDKDEESLECLCKLLSTIGKELETKNVDLNPYFNTMKEIVDKKHGKISSRVRFMLQDVIDLRNAKWVPRRQDMKPKTIDQIQQEAESEHMTNQALNALPLPKREDRGPNMSGSVKKMRNMTDDNGWSTARSNRPSSFAISSDKLKNRVPPLNEPLGPSNNFDMWSKGSAMSKAGSTTATSTNNMYAPLEGLADAEKRGTRTNKDLYATKTSMERFGKFDDGRGSRSSSQQRSRDSSTTSQRSGAGGGSRSGVIPPPQMPSLTKGQSAPLPQTTRPMPTFEIELTAEQLERRLKNILDEYLNECCTISECEEEITTTIPKSAHSNLVSDGYNIVLERSKTARINTGKLFAHLIQRRTLSLEDYCKGLEDVLSLADDLTIDIPKIWDYLAEIIVPLITEESITFKVLHKCCELLTTQGHMADLLAPLFHLIVQEEGAAFLQNRWRESGLRLEDFLPDTDINKFVSDAKVEFLLDSSGNVPSYKPTLTCDEITEKLLLFFNVDASFDEVTKWIETNLGDVVQESYFIKALVTAIFQHSIVGNKLKDDIFKKHYAYLHRFVVGSSEREIQCLYAVQALLNKMEYPQGLLLTIFEKLYEESVIPHESFVLWEDSKDPAEQAGKGVALKQLTSFFTNLKEADDETGSSASEEP
ncbi:eukaryotic translation initiation factor 4 gamma 3 isoform X2 [Agrilus planipennis]|uniref:Eukaryotic translation initiation factor 4 gamma 3 isoform X2 n=1 Tax=Agrilus planipennis TaxID=224129 RepID=A0A7F5QY13_AGRPL|nr:eukaryotic translation initiation factor 4 gamma 3 isoform X2 [Agrilus planipennis]